MTFFKSYLLSVNVEKYRRAGQATHDNITRRMRIACWAPKATNTHSEYVILIAFPLQQWLQESPSSYVTRTLSVLFSFNKNTVVATAGVMLLIMHTRHSWRT